MLKLIAHIGYSSVVYEIHEASAASLLRIDAGSDKYGWALLLKK
jgi:hypothetical protein